jgi:hypothetical protein
MKYAIIENNTVVNVVLADAQFALSNGWVECQNDVEIGWTYADGVFTPPPEPEVVAPPAPTKEELLAELQVLTAKIQALA